jgi:uncharacterized membrane protein YjjB (DUF3815 family)
MILQTLASFFAVICFSIILGVPKKFLALVGMTGAIGWIAFLICTSIFNLSMISASLISAIVIAIVSIVLSKVLKVIVTIFFVPGILPIVPGVSLYRMVYNILARNMELVKYYFFETMLISGAIALSIFIIESLSDAKILKKQQNKNC